MIDYTLDREISINVIKKFDEDREAHTPSGKLSASILGNPLQWQILKVIGVPSEFDEYVKRKLQRGKDVEDWVVKHIKGLEETQKEVSYRNVIGYVDALVDTKNYDNPCGVVPHEIKSVANAKYKNIVRVEEADHSHCLQSSLYALALGTECSFIDYIASDDYRCLSFIVKTAHFKDEIDSIIDNFNLTIKQGIVPEFSAKEPWQSNPKYNSFPDFAGLSSEEATEKLKKDFPEQFKKLKEYK
jgi:hypothetical protein